MLFSALTFLGLISWWRSSGVSIILPGLGLVVSLPTILILLLIVQIVFVALATAAKPAQDNSEINNSQPYNSFED